MARVTEECNILSVIQKRTLVHTPMWAIVRGFIVEKTVIIYETH